MGLQESQEVPGDQAPIMNCFSHLQFLVPDWPYEFMVILTIIDYFSFINRRHLNHIVLSKMFSNVCF
jgi:hypothetical protein